jgi:hypothetical protein
MVRSPFFEEGFREVEDEIKDHLRLPVEKKVPLVAAGGEKARVVSGMEKEIGPMSLIRPIGPILSAGKRSVTQAHKPPRPPRRIPCSSHPSQP